MLNKYSVYFWEPELSPHKLPLFYELVRHPNVQSAVYVAQRHLNDHRIKQGWHTELRDDAEVIIAPTYDDIKRIVRSSPSESVHIFSGMHWVPCIVDGVKQVIECRRRFGILSEPRVFEGMKGAARLAHSWLTEAKLRRRASFILAVGAYGPTWFRMAGYSRQRIFPFAYFLPNSSDANSAPNVVSSEIPVVTYLGRLERLKGFHLFLDCIPLIRNHVKLKVAGYGSLSQNAVEAGRKYSQLDFLGTLPMPQVPKLLATTGILVAPSTTMDDGWGAVVSEALMAGAAVVSSGKVGASMCLRDRVYGIVVQDLTEQNIAAAIDAIINEGYTAEIFRKIRAEWAGKHLDQVAGAQYLLAIFDHLFAGKNRPLSFVEALQSSIVTTAV